MYIYALGRFKALMCFTINAPVLRRPVFSVTAGTVGRWEGREETAKGRYELHL